MQLFSRRHGYVDIEKGLQIKSINKSLRHRLWNIISEKCFRRLRNHNFFSEMLQQNDHNFVKCLWDMYFRIPTDSISPRCDEVYSHLRKYFMNCQWHQVFDFIEFILLHYRFGTRSERPEFIKRTNSILKEEMSGYRIIDNFIVSIISDEEIQSIKDSINSGDKYETVATHFKGAIKLLSDRENPNFRKSIDESICAVEAICKIITKNNNATLGDALKELDKYIELHGALKKAFLSLYGYTSDADGIRHSLSEKENIDLDDAVFMLVICSAFTNYIKSKVS